MDHDDAGYSNLNKQKSYYSEALGELKDAKRELTLMEDDETPLIYHLNKVNLGDEILEGANGNTYSTDNVNIYINYATTKNNSTLAHELKHGYQWFVGELEKSYLTYDATDEIAGKIMIFRPFEHLSYALVMKAEHDIRRLDEVKTR